jgi:hypothetical protein
MTEEVASGFREQPAMTIAIAPSMSSNRTGMDATHRKFHAAARARLLTMGASGELGIYPKPSITPVR